MVACDFSQGMLAAGIHRDVSKVVGDGMHLPFADASFDAVTISFGLRNIPEKVIRSFLPVIKITEN